MPPSTDIGLQIDLSDAFVLENNQNFIKSGIVRNRADSYSLGILTKIDGYGPLNAV